MKYGVVTQKRIYTYGMAGQKPLVPVDYNSLKRKAGSKLSPEAFAYVAGGAGREATMSANRLAFDQYKLKARMMNAASEVDMRVNLFGHTYDTPLLLAPIGALELVHSLADVAVARACKEMGIPMIFSNQSSCSMEECSREMGSSPRWFQLYWSKSDDLVR